jgi:choline dehydrogenase
VPAVNKRSFDDNTPGTYDAAAIAEAMQAARRINSRVSYEHHEVYPGPGVTDLDRFIRQEQYGHHVSCTNPMGAANDAMAVLDGKLRVRGTSNLRVVDASAFPRIVGTFLWLPTAIMSEKASADVLAAAS